MTDDDFDVRREVISHLRGKEVDELAVYLNGGRKYKTTSGEDLKLLREHFLIKGLDGRSLADMAEANNIHAEFTLRKQEPPAFSAAAEAAMQRFADAVQEIIRDDPERTQEAGESLLTEICAGKAESRN